MTPGPLSASSPSVSVTGSTTPRRSGSKLSFRVREPRVPRSTIALLGISILLPLVLFALLANQNRRDVEQETFQRVERTTRILHEHAMKVFDTHQLVLDQVNERVATIDWADPTQVERLHGLLAHLKAQLPQVSNIIVTDSEGRLRAEATRYPANPVSDFSDRDWFRSVKASGRPVPYFSKPIVGREVAAPIFTMSTRIETSEHPGRFDGAISIGINPTYFSDFYADIEHQYAHVVVLAREDGTILSSEPSMVSRELAPRALARLAADESSRFSIQASEIDGEERLFGFEKVGKYPVIIGFGITRSSALAPWWRNMLGYGLVAALSSLALLAVSGFAIRRIALEGRATARWRRTAALLEGEMAERARVEDQLRQSQKMEAVGRLTGGIAHDFNNLLTVVIGSLELLSRRMSGADARHLTLVDNAIDGASRAAVLTGRLLAFSRQHPQQPEAVDVDMLIEGMSNLLQRTLGETVSIQFDIAPDLHPTWVDPNQLENAILNLCVNAVDAMPKGGTVIVGARNLAFDVSHGELAPGEYVMVSVTDTGTGMAENVARRAFDPFFTTKPVGKGTGLGLSQVYGFARQSGGLAEIETELGRGTTIKIVLPQHRAPVLARAPAQTLPAAANDSVAAPVGGATVLVVEDDDLVRRFSSTALREAGYTVHEAGTGPDALRELDDHPEIALLFTDVVLKGPLNGRELADRIFETRPELPVLFTTGYTKDAIFHQSRLDEGVNLLGKPFTSAALASRIAELLRAPVIEECHRAAS